MPASIIVISYKILYSSLYSLNNCRQVADFGLIGSKKHREFRDTYYIYKLLFVETYVDRRNENKNKIRECWDDIIKWCVGDRGDTSAHHRWINQQNNKWWHNWWFNGDIVIIIIVIVVVAIVIIFGIVVDVYLLVVVIVNSSWSQFNCMNLS